MEEGGLGLIGGWARKCIRIEDIHTILIGVGVDFNSDLVEYISKVRGANYFTVNSSQEFKKLLDREFNYMVTPLVYDLKLELESRGL